jgi:glycosyltransferase involved in cell wall biosynthesis
MTVDGYYQQRPLRILQVSTLDQAGGAERLAWNLFRAYRARGHASWLAVGYKGTDDPDVMVIPDRRYQGLWSRFCRGLHGRLKPFEDEWRGVWRLKTWLDAWATPTKQILRCLGVEDFHYPETRRILSLPPQRPDIVHCHNLHGGYFDLRVLPWLSHEMPLILTLSDAWLLSGHCAHSFDCERWKAGCGRCPDLTIYPAVQRDMTAYNWRRKRNIFARSHLYVATPSKWLMSRVTQSMLAPTVVQARVIPNAVDLSVFRPADKPTIRAELGIPQDVKVLLFTANSVQRNIWKDYATMRAAVALVAERLGGQRVLFIALGEHAPAENLDEARIRFVPYQKDPEIVARYYQATDVYIHAARAEVWGLTITEALACGTPVVATAVGGIGEQVKGLGIPDWGLPDSALNRHGLDDATGILVSPGDAPGMALGVERLLRDEPLRLRMGQNAVRDAVKRFDLQRQADDFLSWYQEILKDWESGRSGLVGKPRAPKDVDPLRLLSKVRSSHSQ